MHWSSIELLESNSLPAGWSGFGLRSTPVQSKKITGAIEGGAQLVKAEGRGESV